MATTAQRVHASSIMAWLVGAKAQIHYRQARPMGTRDLIEQDLADLLANGHTISMDCSEAVTLICRLAGFRNPSGVSYSSGVGNTQMMFDHLPHYTDPAAAQVGALCFFGPPGDLKNQHVCMVNVPGHDPALFSHGSEAGPIFLPLSAERKAHIGQVVFLNVAKL